MSIPDRKEKRPTKAAVGLLETSRSLLFVFIGGHVSVICSSDICPQFGRVDDMTKINISGVHGRFDAHKRRAFAAQKWSGAAATPDTSSARHCHRKPLPKQEIASQKCDIPPN